MSCCLVANHQLLVALADPSARGENTTPHAETTTLRAHVSFRVSNASQQPTFTSLHSHCSTQYLRASQYSTAAQSCLHPQSGARSAPLHLPHLDDQREILQSPPARRPWTLRASSSPKLPRRRADCRRLKAARGRGQIRHNRSLLCLWPLRRRTALRMAQQRVTAAQHQEPAL